MNTRTWVIALLGSCFTATGAMATSTHLPPLLCGNSQIPIYSFALSGQYSNTAVPNNQSIPDVITFEIKIADLIPTIALFSKVQESCTFNDTVRLDLGKVSLKSYSASANFEDTTTTASAFATLTLVYEKIAIRQTSVGALANATVGGWNRVTNITDVPTSLQ